MNLWSCMWTSEVARESLKSYVNLWNCVRISEVVCESALFLKEPSSFRENQEVQANIKKMEKHIKIKKVQAHREQTWRKQRRSGGEAHQMAGSATQRFFRFMYTHFFFSFLIHVVLGKSIKALEARWHFWQSRLPAGPLVCGGDDLCQDTSGSSSWSTLFSTTPCNLCTGCQLLGRVKLTDVCFTRLTFSLRILNTY